MGRLTAKDGIAAAILAAVVIPYTGYMVHGDMPLVHDARGMAGVGEVGVLVAFAVVIAAIAALWTARTVFEAAMLRHDGAKAMFDPTAVRVLERMKQFGA